jgi:hypothetical protein
MKRAGRCKTFIQKIVFHLSLRLSLGLKGAPDDAPQLFHASVEVANSVQELIQLARLFRFRAIHSSTPNKFGLWERHRQLPVP